MRKPLLITLVLASTVFVSACGGQQPAAPAAQVPAAQVPAAQVPTAQAPEAPKNAAPDQGAVQADPAKPDPSKPESPKVTEPKAPEPAKPVKREVPNPMRGIHFSGWYAGSPDLARPLLEWAKGAGLNTLVLDIKAEDGKLSWVSDIPLAQEIGANLRKIGDLQKAITEYHDRGFWVVGRIVVMNDQYLYRARPSAAIPGFSGGAYSFMDPTKEVVYAYNMDVARAAVKAGVDEIQWDYIRYPYQKEAQPFMDANTTRESRVEAINSFLKKSVAELHPLGVQVSADVFGLTTSVEEGDDMKIGQNYRSVAEIVDRILPMAYPSHYAANTYGIPDPNRAPYETVKSSMTKAILRTQGIDLSKHVAWIQDFSMHGVTYGPDEVAAQIKALHDVGLTSFMLWDPSNKYQRTMNFNNLKFKVGEPPVAPPAPKPEAPAPKPEAPAAAEPQPKAAQ